MRATVAGNAAKVLILLFRILSNQLYVNPYLALYLAPHVTFYPDYAFMRATMVGNASKVPICPYLTSGHTARRGQTKRTEAPYECPLSSPFSNADIQPPI